MISSAEEFSRLRSSEDPTEYLRAADEDAPLEVWAAVIAQFPELREWVAHNKTLPLPVLEQLAQDLDPRVRSVVATKRKLSVELQQKLAHDVDASVRERLACNAKCSTEVLQLLSADSEAHIRAAANKRLAERSDAL